MVFKRFRGVLVLFMCSIVPALLFALLLCFLGSYHCAVWFWFSFSFLFKNDIKALEWFVLEGTLRITHFQPSKLSYLSCFVFGC